MANRRLTWFFSQFLSISALLFGIATLPSAAIFPHSSVLAEDPSWEGGGATPSSADPAIFDDGGAVFADGGEEEVSEDVEKVQETVDKLTKITSGVRESGLTGEAAENATGGILRTSEVDASSVPAGPKKFLPRDLEELRQLANQSDAGRGLFSPNSYCNSYNCQGFADTFSRFAKNEGGDFYINQVQVISKDGTHTFNYVEFADGWHFVEPQGIRIVDMQTLGAGMYGDPQIIRDAVTGAPTNILSASGVRPALSPWNLSESWASRAVSGSRTSSFASARTFSSSTGGIQSALSSLSGSSGVCTSGGCSGGGGGGLRGILGGLGGSSGAGGGGIGSILNGGGLGGGNGLGGLLGGAGQGGLGGGGLAMVGGLLGSKLIQNQNQNTKNGSSASKIESLVAGLTAEERKTINALCRGKAAGCRVRLIQRLKSTGSLYDKAEKYDSQDNSLDSF